MPLDMKKIFPLPGKEALAAILEYYELNVTMKPEDFKALLENLVQFQEADNESFHESSCENCDDR